MPLTGNSSNVVTIESNPRIEQLLNSSPRFTEEKEEDFLKMLERERSLNMAKITLSDKNDHTKNQEKGI